MLRERRIRRRRLRYQGTDLDVEIPAEVFAPSPYTRGLAENLRIARGETVIDIGTGSGVLAILAAKLGGRVWATDISPAAVACARANAARNGVKVAVGRGRNFAGLRRRFDVIVFNLPQVALPAEVRATASASCRRDLDGGPLGNRVVLSLLRECPPHMHGASRIYMSVDTETHYSQTLRCILERYDVRLLGLYSHALDDHVQRNAGIYRDLSERGRMTIFRQGRVWYGYQYILELSLRSRR
jgi:release factor glutamine methyltransferase